MEPHRDELMSALRDAEEFISVTLSKESLTHETESKRQRLETRLKNLINKSSSGPLPPRPPKPNGRPEEEEGEDLYDDVGPDAIDMKDDVSADHSTSPKRLTMEIQGISKETQDNGTQENYEDMNNEDMPQEETYDDTVNITSEENYEEPGKEVIEDLDYEVTEPKPTDKEENDDVYEGVDAEDGQDNKADAESFEQRERSRTEELEMLTNPVKPAEIEEVIYKGYLDKHRKRGKLYFGNKYQKRFCVVRSFAMYYFDKQNADRQKGTILLPGYQVSVNKQSKSNREFILTRDKDRPYTFQAESKEEMMKWIDAIHKATSNKISKRQSEILDGFRSESLDIEEDSSSLCNDGAPTGSKNGSINDGQSGGGEIYDDVNENDISGSGSIDYEIPQSETSNMSQTEATAKAEPVKEEEVEDFYEMPGDESPEPPAPIQPPRPAVVEHAAPAMPPPPEIPPSTLEEEEDFYDDVGFSPEQEVVTQPPTKPQIPLPTPPSDNGKPSPAMPRPALPPTPGEPKPSIPPRRNVALPPEPGNETPPPTSKAPPPPPPEENNIPEKYPPPPPPEEEETEDQVIDYSNIYQALWDCKPDADDELEFSRGDLIYVYDKPHSDWWIGSKYKPQGYQTRLIPKNYLTEAYE